MRIPIFNSRFILGTFFRLRRLWRGWYYRSRRNRRIAWAGSAVFMLFLFYTLVLEGPLAYPEGKIITVAEGASIKQVAEQLKTEGLIRSKTMLELTIRAMGNTAIAGRYSFQRRENVFVIGWRVVQGDFNITPVRIRILEGSTVRDIAAQLGKELPDFNEAHFLRLAASKEGYLFPDTYFFYPGATPETVLTKLEGTFYEEVNKPGVKAAIERFGKPIEDVVIMASLLEKEVPKTEDRRIVAGILWKRISLGMPLQVDAVFPYIIGKNSYELTRADLALDNPYNTYVYKGLPAGPIANPSLDAILAAVKPVTTDYLFYLSDRHGNIHYSATYEQHLAAKKKYIDS